MLYEEIVDYIISNIESGGIVPGEKLPSIRKIAHKFGVSNPTAVTAYGRLESLGYAVARERSGFVAVLPEESDNVLLTGVNSNVSNIEHMDEIVRLYEKSQNVSYAPFGVGVPSKKFYPNALLKKYSLKVLNSDQTCFSDYTLPEGRLDLRTQILKWIEPWVGIYSPEEVLITNGCLEAINLALSVFCKPQDIVAVESPCYFGMIRALKSQDLRAVEINTDPKDGIDPQCLRKQIRKHNIKVLISTANAQNPLGFSMSDERKKEVLKVCESEGVRIIENDVYGDVTYSKVRPKTYKYFDRKNIVTYCSSFSKTLGPSVRIGWCIPSSDMEVFLKLKTGSNICSSNFNQELITSILKHENIGKITRSVVKTYEQNVNTFSGLLREHMKGEIALSKPTGGWVLWASVPGLNSLKTFELALKEKIAITPGALFSAGGQQLNSFRINCGHEINDKTVRNIKRLCELIDENS